MAKTKTREEKILDAFNEVMDTRYRSLDKRMVDYWINKDGFTLEEVLTAIRKLPILIERDYGDFWINMTPQRFFRQRNSNGTADYIDQAFNIKVKKERTREEIEKEVAEAFIKRNKIHVKR